MKGRCPRPLLGAVTLFAEPSIDDFIAWIDWHIAKALRSASEAVKLVEDQFSEAGAFHRSERIIRSIEAAQKQFEQGVEAVLGELKRTIRKNKMDPKELREHTGQRLLKFASDAKAEAAVCVGQKLGPVSSKLLDEFEQHVKFALRQFDVGNFDPIEPEKPPMANAINIGTMTGSVIQQGSPGATQRAELQLDIKAVTAAVGTLESELSKVHLNEDATAALAADIATIKAQLSKPSPSIRILQETGKSIRNVTEGITGGLLTPGVMAALGALGTALGLN